MNEFLLLLILFISVLVSGGYLLFNPPKNNQTLKLLLSFSGGFLLCISVTHLIPEVYRSHEKNIGIYVLLGFMIQLLLEFFSQGVEHGHIHLPKSKQNFPIVVMISLCIHSFIEGIPLERELHGHHHHMGHEHSGHSLLIGIVLHKIPVALALTSIFIKVGLKKIESLLWLSLFAIMAPLGTLLGHYGFDINTQYLDIALALVIGMLLHISTTILFESSEGHKFNFKKLLVIVLGIGIALLVN